MLIQLEERGLSEGWSGGVGVDGLYWHPVLDTLNRACLRFKA